MIEVEVTTAVPVAPDVERLIVERVRRSTGGEPRLTKRIDPAILGGLVLRVDDVLVDGSLRGAHPAARRPVENGRRERWRQVKLRPEEIASILRPRIENYEAEVEVDEVGTVLEVGDGIARIYGLRNALAGEMLEFAARRHRPGAQPRRGQRRRRAARRGHAHQGRRPRQAHRPGRWRCRSARPCSAAWSTPSATRSTARARSRPSRLRPIEFKAPGIVERQPVKEPLQTGIKAIDAMIPIGRGQRELIIGDRQTGKTAIAIDTIINQKGQDVICIYVAIGQKHSTVAQVVEKLEETAPWSTPSSSPPPPPSPAPLQYIAPYAGVRHGRVLPRQRPARARASTTTSPSRPSPTASSRCCCAARRAARPIPGDVFYLHSRLLERAVKLTDELGGGSLTALPIIETQAGDVSAYIPTNVISITDGQIYLETDLFYSGVRPGHQRRHLGVARRRQRPDQGHEAGRRHACASTWRSTASWQAFAQFGSDLDKATQQQLDRGAAPGRAAQAGPLRAHAGRGAGRRDLRRHAGLPRRHPGRERARFLDGLRELRQVAAPRGAQGDPRRRRSSTNETDGDPARRHRRVPQVGGAPTNRRRDRAQPDVATLQDIRRRIPSTENTRKITKAMELVVGGQAAPRRRRASRRCGPTPAPWSR